MGFRLQSVKSRLFGSYIFLILLFFIQLPLTYMLVGGMSKKYSQVVDVSLRERAIELNYILNRHILNGEEELKEVFHKKRQEFGKAIDELKTGSNGGGAITDGKALVEYDKVKQSWEAMRDSLDKAMESGGNLTTTVAKVEGSTFPMVEKLNGVVQGYVALKNPSYSRNIDMAGLQRMRTVKMSYLMERYARSNSDRDKISSDIKATIKDFDDTLSALRSGSSALGLKAPAGRDLSARLKEADDLWAARKGLMLRVMKDKDAFNGHLTDLMEVKAPAVIAAVDALKGRITAGAGDSARNGLMVMAITVFVSAALAVVFMWVINKQILKPLDRIRSTVEEFAGGDLTKRAGVKVSVLGREIDDEITELSKSVDLMASQMSTVIAGITDSSGLLASAAEQLSASSAQIAEGADRQSNQTTQVATAMEEMNATVLEVARNSQTVSESARQAQETAGNGGKVISQAVSAMKEVAESTSVTAETIKRLGKSSEDIGAIVSVINDIADQTNLLALNAAIEAARAGEQGRGFAVVADEVRKLAERTTRATKEISGMINSIQAETNKAVNEMADGTHKVENGVRLANEAGEALGNIVNGVHTVTEMIAQIATSAEEQSATTEEITQNMESIKDVSKSSVTAIGEAASASNEMARLATELKDLVSKFKVLRGETADGGKGAVSGGPAARHGLPSHNRYNSLSA
ncbi:MAG: methyl-accepting chemotaxis protein [Deltaproteobacteria bacterium]|nr:methyl-accepting chemotaxis protein [Deltaproteobacteria bacterium]